MQHFAAQERASLTSIHRGETMLSYDPIQVVPDHNISNPRFHINRACIYERRLPGDAYITAHVQRLQHGFYSTSAVSDQDYDHVDFLAVSFVFHSPDTLNHRFKAATIRASVHRDHPISSSDRRARSPQFLMHAPHLLYGAVSPETLQWHYSLAGSVGLAQLPLIASMSPAGGINGEFRRYEMMRIQGSVRSLKSARGQRYDVAAGEIVWSLEENNLQRSGLPREFTFAMLIQKPHAKSRVRFALEIDPILRGWFRNYPNWWLALPSYRPVRHRQTVDFRESVGQRFRPVTSNKGFNFAKLASSFDDYAYMPGRRFALNVLPDGALLDDEKDDSIAQRGGPMSMKGSPWTETQGISRPVTTIPLRPRQQPVTIIRVAPGMDLQYPMTTSGTLRGMNLGEYGRGNGLRRQRKKRII